MPSPAELRPPEHGGTAVALGDIYRMTAVTDEELLPFLDAWMGRWFSTAKDILEFGEEGLGDGFTTEQASAVLLLIRAVRFLRPGEVSDTAV